MGVGAKQGRGVSGRTAELLLLPEDEVAIIAAIAAAVPDVRYVDNDQWVEPTSPQRLRRSSNAADMRRFGARGVHSNLPVAIMENGSIVGPQTGPVVQWLRSLNTHADGMLRAGRWAVSSDPVVDPIMAAFISTLWKILYKNTTNKLRWGGVIGGPVDPNGAECGYRMGRAELAASESGAVVLAAGRMRLIPEQ